jgi:hypothetical protein
MCEAPPFSRIRNRRRAPKLRGKHVFRVRACGQKNILKKDLVKWKKGSYICTRFGQENLSLSVFEDRKRAHSSVGSERLPYKQDVGGSNPSVPTSKQKEVTLKNVASFF